MVYPASSIFVKRLADKMETRELFTCCDCTVSEHLETKCIPSELKIS
jgi:hypothetical protein